MSIITLGDGTRQMQFPLLGVTTPDRIQSIAQEFRQAPGVADVSVSTELTIHVTPDYTDHFGGDARRALALQVHERLKERLAAGLIVV